MADTSLRPVTRMAPRIPSRKPDIGLVSQKVYQPNAQTDKVRTTVVDRTDGNRIVHIYDQVNLRPAETDSQDHYATPLLSDQNSVIQSINTKLDSMESNQNRLAAQFQDSQTLILAELSQVKEMVKTLSDLVKTSLTTFQKMSAQQEHNVHELAANLGQEVFQVGQEVLTTIREKNNEDTAYRTWRQECAGGRMASLTSESKKKSKKNSLPSL